MPSESSYERTPPVPMSQASTANSALLGIAFILSNEF